MMMCMCPGMSIIVAMKAERGLIFKYCHGKRTDPCSQDSWGK